MADVRTQLVETGVRLLEADGLERLSLRRIAHAAGVSHGAPRHHFPTYEALLAAIARRGLEDLDAALAPILASEADPPETLRRLAAAYLEFARRRPAMFDLVTRHDLLQGAGGRLREITGPWLVRVTALLGGDPTRALALWSGIHGLAVLVRQRSAEPVLGEVPDPAAVAALLVERLRAG